MRGDRWLNIVHPGDQEHVRQAWERTLSSGAIHDHEHREKHADGDYQWVRAYAAPRKGADGKILGWFGQTENIDARKRAELRLRESDARLHFVIENCPHLFWISRPDGEIVDFSPRLGALVDISLSEALDQGWLARIDPEHREAVRLQFEHTMRTGETLDLHYRLQRPDGMMSWVRAWGAPRRGDDGAIIEWYGTITPVLAPEAPSPPSSPNGK
ncbi:PAS domain-containing protein [Xanthobacter autotrophicus]|uniref:PAS domain-containing protein n=1 Tax=Xanthobacter autotrophicus TaxID=280 RepID=UPI003727960E